jgi:hypothetical protein
MRRDSVRTDSRGYGRSMRRLACVVLALAPLPPVAQRVAPAASHVVVFIAHDYSYGGPDSVPAGLTTEVVQNCVPSARIA